MGGGPTVSLGQPIGDVARSYGDGEAFLLTPDAGAKPGHRLH